MHKKLEINQTKIKDGCQLGRKVVTHNSKRDLPLRHMVQAAARTFMAKYFLYIHAVKLRLQKATRPELRASTRSGSVSQTEIKQLCGF